MISFVLGKYLETAQLFSKVAVPFTLPGMYEGSRFSVSSSMLSIVSLFNVS